MDISTLFKTTLPTRPYCSNNPKNGLRIRITRLATRYKYIQPNIPTLIRWINFDLDFEGAAFAWEKVGLPPPSIIIGNPVNGHAHLMYGIQTPIIKNEAAHDAPIRYTRAIKAAYSVKLRADPGYSGLIVKNPLHKHWRTQWTNKLYDLGELAEYVTLPKRLPNREIDEIQAGRNCTLFEQLRQEAYRWVLSFKQQGSTFEQWLNHLLALAENMNVFDVPLSYGEIKSSAASVAKWSWRNFSSEKFSAIQSARGKRGGRPKTTTIDGEPWLSMNISRATYYRQLKSGILVPE